MRGMLRCIHRHHQHDRPQPDLKVDRVVEFGNVNGVRALCLVRTREGVRTIDFAPEFSIQDTFHGANFGGLA